jgi:ribonuclease HI
MDTYELYFDGCSKGNPGRAGAGSVIYKNNNELFTNSLFIGEEETNNVTEYTGSITYQHVYRKDNKRADELSNIGCGFT